jgi:hypothetical protein
MAAAPEGTVTLFFLQAHIRKILMVADDTTLKIPQAQALFGRAETGYEVVATGSALQVMRVPDQAVSCSRP